MPIQEFNDTEFRLKYATQIALQFFIRGTNRSRDEESSTCPYCFRNTPHADDIHKQDAKALEQILHSDVCEDFTPAIRLYIKALWNSVSVH